MFCPKCGLQNADETKFCRGCGANLSSVLAAVDKKKRPKLTLAEKHIALYSRGIRGILTGIGFLIISAVVYNIAPQIMYSLWFSLTFAFVWIAAGISRLIQAKGIKELSKRVEPAALASGQADYIKPSRSIYETDDLTGRPLSVTERTTTHLEMCPDGETILNRKQS